MIGREYITHNFWLKLLSILLAIVVWATLSSDEIQIRFRPTPATQAFIAHKLGLLRDVTDPRAYRVIPEAVDVVVSGDEVDVRALKPERIQAFVDLRNVKSDERTAPITVNVPKGINVESIMPKNVTLDLLNP